MKLTKEQWKQLSDRIFLTLRPTQHPVAMKFIKTPEEFDAIPDIEFCQKYFRSEKRDPTITEIRLIDTYWSDHCRHTTFGTIIDDVKIDDELVQAAFDRYMALRAETGRDKKNRTLMDCATIGAKALKQRGILKNLDESEEINACTVKIKCDVDGEQQDWLFLFKNETHNHPTEIEPFGGAATCIGGAIRDPLSGRSYVYQAMRVTGAADPLKPVSETMPGKLPQRKLVTTAAAGYSSYGNQIGLATGMVDELYHPDKINYATYGDGMPHVHVHIVPKYKGGVSWGQPFSDSLPKVLLTDAEYDAMIADLRAKLL